MALGTAASAAFAQQQTGQQNRPQPITGDFRLLQLQNFVSDAALVRSTWLEARGDYADWGDGGKDSSILGIVAYNLKDTVELGGSFGYLDRSRSEDQVLFGEHLSGDFSNNGFADVNLYAKWLFKKGDHPWAAGFLAKAPTADDNELLGSGAWDYEFFVANRRPRERFVWLWNGAVRFNGDPSFSPGAGATSVALGGGALLKLSYSWMFMAEARFETPRYEGDSNDFSVTPSFDFRPTENIALRLGVGFGLADGAPDLDYTFGFVFHL